MISKRVRHSWVFFLVDEAFPHILFYVISEVILRSPFYAYQAFLCIFFLERLFFALWRTETILYLSVFFMLIGADGPFYACRA